MVQNFNTVIIGGGQAGLSTSYFLKKFNINHIILEKADKPAFSWREQRWDSFCFVIPNWTIKLPGLNIESLDLKPSDFIGKKEILNLFEDYINRNNFPLLFDNEVVKVIAQGDQWLIQTKKEEFLANNVVVANGFFQKVNIPDFAKNINSSILQLDTISYKNTTQLKNGGVLVVGSGQSGMQIAEEVNQAGFKVYLSVGSTGRVPRMYRGRDIIEWLVESDFFNRPVESLDSPKMRNLSNPQISGKDGGHSLNLHEFYREGIILLGHLIDANNYEINFEDNLYSSLEKNNQFQNNILNFIDDYIIKNSIKAPFEYRIESRDGFNQELLKKINLESNNIKNIIWTTGFTRDYSFIKTDEPIADKMGYPIQTKGCSNYKGLFFIGNPWLSKNSSGFVLGVADDAEYISNIIIKKIENP